MMKKTLAWLLSLAMLLTMISGVALAETNTATVTGFGGDVTVTVTTDDAGVITEISAEGANETEALGGEAIKTLNAGALAALVGQKLADVDFDAIDAVAGATVTSTAVKNAAKMVKTNVTGAVAGTVADGTYTATTPSFSVTDQLTIEVTFENGKLTAINTVNNGSTDAIFATVESKLYPRLIEAQSLEVDAITGATVSSNAVKTAVAMAIEQAGGDTSTWHTPIAKSEEKVTLEGYDVIVVGLGGSGMTSYLSAAENGATVFGFDSAAKVGGNSTNTSGPMAINPASRLTDGKDLVPVDELVADWMAYTDGDAKEDMIRLFVNASGETLDWMEKYSFQFGDTMKAFFDAHGWQVWTSYAGKDGKTKDEAYVEALDTAKAMNEKNDYMLELTAKKLLQDENGNVVGVEATRYDGATYDIYGKNVILATGGFIGNDEMCNEYLGGVWRTDAMTQCNGAGILMAEDAVDAALYNPDVAPVSHIAQVYNIVKNDDLTKDQKAILTSLVLDTTKPIVSADGTSVNDKIGMFIAFDVWQAGPTYYVIYTQEQMDAIKANGLEMANTPMFMAQGGTVEAGVPVTDLDTILSVGETYGDVFKADSLEALAEQLNMPNLTASVEAKEGAYYAVKGASYVYSTCGGLDIDENLNVLRKDGTAVTNLFAVGNDSIGVLLESGKAYVTYGGAAAGWALTSGRLAGATAAAQSK